jgi:hypothetical protein
LRVVSVSRRLVSVVSIASSPLEDRPVPAVRSFASPHSPAAGTGTNQCNRVGFANRSVEPLVNERFADKHVASRPDPCCLEVAIANRRVQRLRMYAASPRNGCVRNLFPLHYLSRVLRFGSPL